MSDSPVPRAAGEENKQAAPMAHADKQIIDISSDNDEASSENKAGAATPPQSPAPVLDPSRRYKKVFGYALSASVSEPFTKSDSKSYSCHQAQRRVKKRVVSENSTSGLSTKCKVSATVVYDHKKKRWVVVTPLRLVHSHKPPLSVKGMITAIDQLPAGALPVVQKCVDCCLPRSSLYKMLKQVARAVAARSIIN